MQWGAVGAIAELLGAIGVIASLFYVASQIRRNSLALEATTNQAVSDSTQLRLLAPAQNPALAAALAKARGDYDALYTRRARAARFLQPSNLPRNPECLLPTPTGTIARDRLARLRSHHSHEPQASRCT